VSVFLNVTFNIPIARANPFIPTHPHVLLFVPGTIWPSLKGIVNVLVVSDPPNRQNEISGTVFELATQVNSTFIFLASSTEANPPTHTRSILVAGSHVPTLQSANTGLARKNSPMMKIPRVDNLFTV
jgi:hypothetical protein